MQRKTKREITELVFSELKALPENPWKEFEVDALIFKWWQTGRAGSGLRLTDNGLEAFTAIGLEYYDFPLDVKMLASIEGKNFFKTLTKKLDCPYYLGVYKNSVKKGPYLRIYNHKIAMLVSLYGTIDDYLNSIK